MIAVPDRYQGLVSTAAADKCPIVVASVDADGQPHLAYYGTVQFIADGRMAWWSRKPGDLLERLAANPRVSMIYWNAAERVMLKFLGTAAPTDDPQERDEIFTGSPEGERRADPERNGTALVVELSEVSGFDQGAPVAINASATE